MPKYIQNILSKINPNIIYDFDDALYADQESYNNSRFLSMLVLAKLIVLENEDTLTFVKPYNENIVKITGPIDCGRYNFSIKKRTDVFTIGWIGSSSTTKYLDIVKNPIRRLNQKYSKVFQLNLIGASDFEMDEIVVNKFKWSLKTENELLSLFDIGIMPLFDDIWSRGKGAYKLLQYMSKGIPSVVSPVGINSQIVTNGVTGFIAQSEEEWFFNIEKLFLDKTTYTNIALNARKLVEEKFSFEHYTPLLISQIEKVSRGDT